jgi:signal transduction histidine kinase
MRIDQQKGIENALMEAVYHAEESDRLKSAFLANISHEIRTPLNAIVGFSEVLTNVEDESERMSLLNLIKKNNADLLRIFDDIMSMSKLEARGGEALKKSTFKLKDVLEELADKYQDKSKETGVPIVIENVEQLPILNTDRDRLREILNQYLDNAMKFTKEGQVTIGCTSQGDKVRIWVRDTGIGIPDTMCNEHLFERFVKVDEFVSGTGLGLSICRSLALSMNGEVGVESQKGKGSTFWVELEKN